MSAAEETFNTAEVEQTLAEAVENVEEYIQAQEAEEELEAELEAVVEAVEKELQSEFEEAESDSDYDEEDDFDPNETIMERIAALKEILSPFQRELILNSISVSSSSVKSLTGKFTSGLWYLTTTGLLLGVPLAIAIFGETQLMELEKELGGMQAQAAPAAAAPAQESN